MAEMKLGRNTILAAGVFATIIAGITPTLAGFQFRPAADTAPAPGTYSQPVQNNNNYVSPSANYAQPAAPRSAMPVPYVTPTSTATSSGAIINWDASTQQMPAQSVQGIEAVPLSSSGRRRMPAATASSADSVSGFGSDLPLLVALQQVVPQQYKVSLSPGVDGGVHVSWQGDRPWEQVLSSMLSPVHLDFVLRGNALVVKHKGNDTLPLFPAVAATSQHAPETLSQDSVTGKVKWDNPSTEMSAGGAPQQLAPTPRRHSAPMTPVTPAPVTTSPVQEAEVAALPAPAASHTAPPPDAAAEVMLPGSDDALPVVAADAGPVKMVPEKIAPEKAAAVPVHTPATPTPLAAAPPAAPATASKSAPLETTWRAQKGQTLKAVLEGWSKTAHTQLYWSTDYDYKLGTDVTYDGSFEESVGKLLDQFSAAKPQPYGQLHRNSTTGGILVVNTYGTYN